MRISDWSSDVCSSDLARAPRFAPVKALLKRQPVQYLRGLELDDIVEQQRRKRVADRQCGVEAAAESLPHFLKRLGIRIRERKPDFHVAMGRNRREMLAHREHFMPARGTRFGEPRRDQRYERLMLVRLIGE